MDNRQQEMFNATLTLLQRVNLKGNEVPAFNLVVDWLKEVTQKREPQSGQWMPIETVPDQFEEILVTDGSTVALANDYWDDDDGRVFHNGSIPYRVATHWMPLPELPKKATGGATK